MVAGEPSGDLHGSRVVTALRDHLPGVEIDAVGGPRMADAGATIVRGIDGLTAMGLVEVLGKIPAHLRLERAITRDFARHRYDLFLPIDYPGFNIRLAAAAKRHGIPVLWYIAPQLWGWRPGRARHFARIVDRLAVILPFEPAFFARVGVTASFVGHPLLDAAPAPDRAMARGRLGIPAGARVLGLFPGSRRSEVTRLWPVMRGAAEALLQRAECDIVVVAATGATECPGSDRFLVVRDDAATVLAVADAVVAKSGTTTLQAALADVPMVVAYAINPLSARLLRRWLTARWVALPNLVAERNLVPELLQQDLTLERLVAETGELLRPGSERAAAQRAGLAEVRRRLGGAGASVRVAALAGELLAA